MTSRDGKYLSRSEMLSLQRERQLPGELAFLSSEDGGWKQGFGKFRLWSVSKQPAVNDSWVLLRHTPGAKQASSAVMLPELHAWPGRKVLPLLPPWHGGAGTCHGAAHEEHLSALLHATATLVSAGSDAWRGKMV